MPLEDTPLSCISKASVKERIRYYFGDQSIPEAVSFKYLGVITRSDLIMPITHYENHGPLFIS